jgi:hypothetical protein
MLLRDHGFGALKGCRVIRARKLFLPNNTALRPEQEGQILFHR